MLYEFVCGALPFGNNASDPYQIYTETLEADVKFPSFFNDTDTK
jgi:cGMP-dependent protein kinase